jgi:RNA polymerase sigma-70 factor (ECF subfamily)
LLARAGAGDSTAFIEIYQRHRVPVFRFVYRLAGSVELAEDITHDCFLSLIRRPRGFQSGRASLRTYLYAAARNLWLKELRSAGREWAMDDLDDDRFVSFEAPPLLRVLDSELSTKVQEAVAALPPLQREALVLFEYEGLALSEIADISGTDVGAVKSRLHRARQGLKRMLTPYLNGNPELNTSREIVTLEAGLK